MNWTVETTWSTVCSEPHSQAAEEAIPHLYRQEPKRPTPVRRRLSRTQALLGSVIPGVCLRATFIHRNVPETCKLKDITLLHNLL